MKPYLAFLLVVPLVACDATVEPNGLEPVLYPALDELEDDVRDQLNEGRSALEAKLAAGAEEQELARQFGSTGMLYHLYQLRSAADSCYRNAARLDPGEFRWAYYSAQLALDIGDLDRAKYELQRALDLRPDEVPAMLCLARVEMESNRLDEARRVLERAHAARPDDPAVLFNLGKLASLSGDYETAVEHLERARALAPQATEIHYPLGLAYRRLGRVEQAASLMSELGGVTVPLDDPWMREIGALVTGARVHHKRGTSLLQDGLYEQALGEFRLALREAPDDPLVRMNLAVTLIHLGDHAGAAREFESALRLDPTDAFANLNYGTLLVSQGRVEEAISHFRSAIEHDPGQLRAHLSLANALVRTGQPADALVHYQFVSVRDPADFNVLQAEARALVSLGRWDEARMRLEDAHAIVPENKPIRNDLARLLAASPDPSVRNGRRAHALAQGLLASPMPLDHMETLAMVAAENGGFGEAVNIQQHLIKTIRAAGRDALLSPIVENLERYRARQACRDPWPDG